MKEITKKLLEIQKKRPVITKDWKAVYWKYITLDNLIDSYSDILNSNGLLIYHSSFDWVITTNLVDIASWEQLTSSITTPAWLKAQETGSRITYAKRYNIWMLLNVIVNEDDDWNGANGNKVTAEKPLITKEQLQKQLDKVKALVDDQKEYPLKPKFMAKLSEYYALDESAYQSIENFYTTILF